MQPQLDNKVLQSVFQWFDHTLLQDGQAFENKTGTLYEQLDGKIDTSLFKYASPHKQWVVDSSVSGAIIATGIDANGTPIPFDNNLFADWNNGRVISTSDLGDNLSAAYATKNFNTYITNDSEEKLLFQNRYAINDFYTLPASGIAPYQLAAPACFLTFNSTDSKAYAMGSSDFQQKNLKVRAIVMTNNTFHLDGALSIFGDKQDKNIPVLDLSDDQFNRYGGLKSSYSGVYRYTDFLSQTDRDKIYIDKVITSKFFAGSHELMPQGMQIGFVNFNLTYFRSPQ